MRNSPREIKFVTSELLRIFVLEMCIFSLIPGLVAGTAFAFSQPIWKCKDGFIEEADYSILGIECAVL